MVLALDVGNTNIVIGAFEHRHLRAHWRVSTNRHRTADEHGVLLRHLLGSRGLDATPLEGMILCCVVPPLLPVIEDMTRDYFGREVMIMGAHLVTGIINRYEEPREVGADRIANAVAAAELYGVPAIIADFGTATTVDVVSARREYLGGAIAPGITISADALFERAAALPKISLTRPPCAVGTNTVHSMQSGIVYGYAGLVKELVARVRTEVEGEAKVIATGGLAGLIASELEGIDVIDPNLTLQGLRIVWEMNK